MRRKLNALLIVLSLLGAVLSCGPVVDAVTGGDTCTVSETGLNCPTSDYGGGW